MKKIFYSSLLITILFLMSSYVLPTGSLRGLLSDGLEVSFIAMDAKTGKVVVQKGASSDEPVAPYSTITIPMCLMGYDLGILFDETQPESELPYLAQQIGLERCKAYLEQFDYGNKDISDLKITPKEQALFLIKLLNEQLNVSKEAYELMKKSLFRETLTGGWRLFVQSGSGCESNALGKPDVNNQTGWLVGWIENDQETYTFALSIRHAKPGALADYECQGDQSVPYKPKKVIVVGASSGMGRQTVIELSKRLGPDAVFGLVARREELLKSLQKEISQRSHIKIMNVGVTDNVQEQLKELINEMGGLDVMVISTSSFMDTKFADTWEAHKKIIDVDLLGFLAVANVAAEYFKQQKSGHLVGISSLDGLRGTTTSPVYSGTKAFIAKYLEGMRNRMIQANIPVYVTELIPGYVSVEHTDFNAIPSAYWVATAKEAATDIADAIMERKKVEYITKRNRLIAWLLGVAPDWMYNKLGYF